MKDGPQPFYHDGVLAPDQPDPACFWAPYQDENRKISSSEAQERVCLPCHFYLYIYLYLIFIIIM
jgi:hypothetical protein